MDNVQRRRLLAGFAATALAPLAGVARATPKRVIFEGQAFDLRVTVAGAELRLNGTGVRQVAWFKGYLCALYLGSPADSAAQALAMAGPKRIHLRMLQEVPAAEFSKAMRKGIVRNSTPPVQQALAARVERFSAQIDSIGKVRAKDVVDLDLDPARGLLMSLNGALRGDPVPGEDFYAALLRSFVGEVPYDTRMRAGLLGRPAG